MDDSSFAVEALMDIIKSLKPKSTIGKIFAALISGVFILLMIIILVAVVGEIVSRLQSSS